MASIDLGSGSAGKKAVDASIPLVPFIDLLLCCVMFLLVTAVWNELGNMQAKQELPGSPTADQVEVSKLNLVLLLSEAGYVVSSTAGDRIEIPRVGADYDVAGLRERLTLVRNAHPNEHSIILAPDDGVAYESVITTMDAVTETGFSSITL